MAIDTLPVETVPFESNAVMNMFAPTRRRNEPVPAAGAALSLNIDRNVQQLDATTVVEILWLAAAAFELPFDESGVVLWFTPE